MATPRKPPRPEGEGTRGPRKGNGGRPPLLEVDDALLRQVEAMAGLGLTLDQIGLILGIAARTVRSYKRRFPKLQAAYKRGKARGDMLVVNSLRNLIQAGNVAATLFYLKTQCGWRETSRVEMTGAQGGPISTQKLTKAGADELRRKILGMEDD